MPGLRRIIIAVATVLGSAPGLPAQGPVDTLVIVTGGQMGYPIPGAVGPVESSRISDLLFLRLGRFSGTSYGDKAATPELARRWTRKDPVTLEFELDSRARWHDGTPVTAEDVLYSFERARDPKRAPSLAPLLDGIASVERGAQGTIVVRFTRPYGEQLYDATHHVQVLPRHLMAAIAPDSLRASAFAQAPVGNGPYRWARSAPGQFTELEAVPDFFLGAPAIDRVVWRFAPSHDARLNEVLGGNAEVMEDIIPPLANLDRLKSRSDLRVAHFPSQSVVYLLFNQRNPADTTSAHPAFGRVAVRRALTLALDRETMIKALLGKYGATVSGPTPSAAWYRPLAPKPPPFDPRAAREALARDGWRDTDGDGVLEREGQRLRANILVPNTSQFRVQVAQVVQQQWRAVGVDAEVQPVEGPVFGTNRRTGQFDVSVESYSFEPSPWGHLVTWGCKGADNLARYCNPVADSLLAAAHWSPDDPAPLLRQYFTAVSEDHPAAFLFSRDFVFPIPRSYRSPDFHPESPYLMLWTWRPER